MSLLNLLILICYKRVINSTVFVSLLILICYKRVINRTVFCEFIESTDFDLLQKSDKQDSVLRVY